VRFSVVAPVLARPPANGGTAAGVLFDFFAYGPRFAGGVTVAGSWL
jgi:hypothetical protein